MHPPAISVGMPLYNNAETLRQALDSVLSQSENAIEVILSDDGSTDDTWRICEDYADRDSRIRAHRHPRLGYYDNFRFTLDASTAPYFVWLAGDDHWHPDYLARCRDVLDTRPEVVGCVARCQFSRCGHASRLASGTYPLTGSVRENVARYLSFPSDNTRLFGVFRREALVDSFPTEPMHAYDWALCASTLRFGQHHEIADILMARDETPPAAHARLTLQDHRFVGFRLFPVLKMTLYLFWNRKVPISRAVLLSTLKLNVYKHQEAMFYCYPKAYRLLRPVYAPINRRAGWRF